MTDSKDAARTAHYAALAAAKEWSAINAQRSQLAQTCATCSDSEKQAAITAYIEMCELEMVRAGLTIVALLQANQAILIAYTEAAGEELIAVSPE